MAKIGKINLITGSTAINKAIDSIAARGKRLDTDIHKAALSTLYHVLHGGKDGKPSGDTTLFERLVEAMPRSGRAKALVTWAEDYTPLTSGESGYSMAKGWQDPSNWDLEAAAADPFWAHTQEQKPANVTLKGLQSSVNKRLKTGVAQGNISEEQAAMVAQAFIAAMESANDESAEVVQIVNS